MWNEAAKQKYRDKIKNQEAALEEFLDKAPKWKGETYRGITITEDDLKSYKKGATIDMKGTSSWSSSKEIGENWAGFQWKKKKGQVHILFSSNGQKNGTSASFFSNKGNEKEVIVSKKSKYKINNIERKGNRVYIDLKEV